MKKYKLLIGLGVFLLFLLLIFIFFNKKKNEGDDYRIGVLADDGIAMVSVSKQRRMTNFLKVSPEAKIWIPEGMGWYRSEVVSKILDQENKKNLANDVLFYNFGFRADKIFFLKSVDNWRNKLWLRIKINNLIIKTEQLNNDSDIKSEWLDKIMMRDFSDSKVFDEDLKISVINTSKETGLAGFISKNLERMGFLVVSVLSGENTDVDGCTILYGDQVEKKYSWGLLKEIFNCKIEKELSLNGDEVELYFDDKFTSVIKYNTYSK